MPLRTPLHAVAARVHARKSYTICSLYLTPGQPVTKDALADLLHQLPPPLLLLGDFNIRHPLWGDMVTSPSAGMLLSIMADFSLGCLNTGDPTHFHSSTSSYSCIDLSLSLFLIDTSGLFMVSLQYDAR